MLVSGTNFFYVDICFKITVILFHICAAILDDQYKYSTTYKLRVLQIEMKAFLIIQFA
jgi:hypothetical protein